MKKQKLKKSSHPIVRKGVPKKKTSSFKSVLRFLPAILLFVTSAALSSLPALKSTGPSSHGVLSYATSMTISDLVTATNGQRNSNGVASLSLSDQLTNAAQAKANDMVARNYWSHTTPDGEQPWVFISRAGYQYTTAGENLAYGFDTGTATVTGWMNSPPHRQNLLNTAFVDVGFGFANSPNFVSVGEQTVVVAMYGAPKAVATPVTTAPASPSPPTTPQSPPPTHTQPVATPTPTTTPTTEAIQTSPAPTPIAVTTTKNPDAKQTKNANTVAPVATAVQVQRIQMLTGGSARWSGAVVIISLSGVVILWMFKRSIQIRHLLRNGEKFFLTHLNVDLAVIGLLTLGYSLLQTSGVIR